jgi:CRP/FNR family cyclic AMP-dependent transcriptional regulator
MSLAPPALSRREELRPIGLFGGLGDQTLGELADSLDELHMRPGDVLFREGDDGREMYVLLDGEVEVVKRSRRGTDARVALFGPGDWFGEMSILDIQPRSATLRAVSPSRLVRITASNLDALYRLDLKGYSLMVLNIARELSRRLRVTDGLLAEVVANVVAEYGRPR